VNNSTRQILALFYCCLLLIPLGLNSQDWADLNHYQKANQQLDATAPGEKRVVFMGNSITEGWKKFDSTFFYENPYVNRGISGQTTPQMLLRFRADVIDLYPAAVVILAGTNDIAGNTGPITHWEIMGNIISMVELAQANDIIVVLCSVLPAASFPWKPELQPVDSIIYLNQMIRNYATINELAYLDYYSFMVDAHGGLQDQFTYDVCSAGLP